MRLVQTIASNVVTKLTGTATSLLKKMLMDTVIRGESGGAITYTEKHSKRGLDINTINSDDKNLQLSLLKEIILELKKLSSHNANMSGVEIKEEDIIQ